MKVLDDFFRGISKDLFDWTNVFADDNMVDKKPDMSWTKKNIKNYMDDLKVEYNSGDTKADLLDKIKYKTINRK